MRILHIVGSIDPKAGGVSEAIRALLQYGPAEYHQEVVSLDDPAAAFLSDLPVPAHAFGPAASPFAYTPRLKPWLLANRNRFDAVFVHGLWGYGGLVARQVFSGHIPYAVFPHGMLDPYFKRAFPRKHIKKWLYWLAVEYWLLRSASKVVFTCQTEAELARQSFWLHRWNPHVVAFGATEPVGDAGDQEAQRQFFLTRFPHLRNRRFLLFLGRIHPKKGCDLLIEAFAKAAALDPSLDLVMAGPDPDLWQTTLMHPLANSALASRVHWLGMLQGDLKWGAFFASEAFILPSHQENFGLAVAEALACGRPVLLSDKVNIAPDIFADGAALIATDTPAGTLQLLERWIATPAAVREAMGQQALVTFAQRYDMRTNAPTILRLFEPTPATSHPE